MYSMDGFSGFFLVLFMAVFVTVFARQLHIPWAVGLIAAGALVGPFGFDLLTIDTTHAMLAEIGLLFLLFMAGLETRLSSFTEYRGHIALYSVAQILVPALFAASIMLFFDLTIEAGIALTIVFISSSIAVILPALEAHGLMHTRIGKIIIDSVVLVDVLSLVALSMLIAHETGGALSPLPYIVALGAALAVRYAMPTITRFLMSAKEHASTTEQELRVAVVMLIGMSVLFDVLGLHFVIGGFIAGLLLSETISSKHLMGKIHTLGYGFFIPIFFVVVGAQTDLSMFFTDTTASHTPFMWITVTITLAAILSKLFAGYLAAMLDRGGSAVGYLAGAAGIPRLSTTLIAVYALTGSAGCLCAEVAAALVVMTIVTTILGPILLAHANNILTRTHMHNSIGGRV
jgi:Kef-type K+ transport system membrane component KefB